MAYRILKMFFVLILRNAAVLFEETCERRTHQTKTDERQELWNIFRRVDFLITCLGERSMG